MPDRQPDDFERVRSTFEGKLVRLRAIEEDDLTGLSELFNDPEVLHFLQQVVFPEPLAGTLAWWKQTRASPSQEAFAVETLAGELIGACDLVGISGRTRTAVLGIWIGKPYWDRGYGTDTVRTLCGFAFQEMNLQRIQLQVHKTNPRGVRAYEKVGFKEEGRLRRAHFVEGRYVDVILMGLLAEDLLVEP
jgi:RimJ/RimL family protein N-acetyltransferase